jgi:hypothetical protein
MFEFSCHEGNDSLRYILEAAQLNDAHWSFKLTESVSNDSHYQLRSGSYGLHLSM